ncbi:MAG: chemotaxis protein CheW [Candidatus Gracilibacteria bacterium]|nr:chemotaxis protein CheW [Candidatus Gracilibacteria bacterium]
MAIIGKDGSGAKGENEYLTFGLNSEMYGVPIQFVREIIKGNTLKIESIPYYSTCVMGITKLRNTIFLVVDLKKAFGMGDTEIGEQTCVIIVEIQKPDMLKCWETKNCSQNKCPAYGSKDRRCWMIPKTFCGGQQQGSVHQKEEACRRCEVRIHSDKNKSVEQAGLVVDRVHGVVNFSDSEIETGSSVDQTGSEHTTGFGKKQINGEPRVIILIDPDKLSCI